MSKFKVGQTWRTRGGSSFVRITEIHPDQHYPVKGVVLDDGEGDTYGFTSEGLLYSPKENHFDLVELSSSVYIAGPMTGYADLNFPAFNAAAKLYRDKGCFVINPAELNGGEAELALYATMSEEEKAEHYTACMRKDIAAITTVDTLVVLPGYSMSRGATMEIQIAQFLGLTIVWPE